MWKNTGNTLSNVDLTLDQHSIIWTAFAQHIPYSVGFIDCLIDTDFIKLKSSHCVIVHFTMLKYGNSTNWSIKIVAV